MHRQADAEVRIVIKICSRRNNPIDETRPDQRDERGHSKSGGSKRARQRHAHGHIGFEHLFREEPAGFAQARRVVSHEGTVDQVNELCAAGDGRRIDAASTQEFTLLLCQSDSLAKYDLFEREERIVGESAAGCQCQTTSGGAAITETSRHPMLSIETFCKRHC